MLKQIYNFFTIRNSIIINLGLIIISFFFLPQVYLDAQKGQNIATINGKDLELYTANKFLKYNKIYTVKDIPSYIKGQYLVGLDKIILSDEILEWNKKEQEELLLHEYIHVITHKKLPTDKKRELYLKLDKLFKLISDYKEKYFTRETCNYEKINNLLEPEKQFRDNLTFVISHIFLETNYIYTNPENGKICSVFAINGFPQPKTEHLYLGSYYSEGMDKKIQNYLSFEGVTYQGLDELITYFFQNYTGGIKDIDSFFTETEREKFSNKDLEKIFNIYKDIYIQYLREDLKNNINIL